jgi:hypothetical protein
MIDETKAAFLPGDGSIVDIEGYWDHISPSPKVRILLADEEAPEGSDLSGLIGRIAAHVGDAVRRNPAFAPFGATYNEHSSVWCTPQSQSSAYPREGSPAEPPETAPLAATAYPCCIRGLSGDGRRNFNFDRRRNEETVRRLIGEIPTDTVVVFYDRSYPSPSDPGAYVSFRRVNGAYLYQLQNHGWSTRWKRIDKVGLERYLERCAWHNRGADQVSSASMFYYRVQPWNRRWWQVWKPRV